MYRLGYKNVEFDCCYFGYLPLNIILKYTLVASSQNLFTVLYQWLRSAIKSFAKCTVCVSILANSIAYLGPAAILDAAMWLA